jgi:hypothetical protein
MASCGMWHCVDLALTDVSEEHIASIFRVEISASGEPALSGGCSLQTRSMGSLSTVICNWKYKSINRFSFLEASHSIINICEKVIPCVRKIRDC